MNNYQVQQFWNDINGVIGFATSIVVLGFLFGMTRSITKPLGNPNTKALPSPQEVKGTCYEDAWRFLIKQEEGELVHGTVESLGKRIGHAWVELDTGFIYEPQTARFFEPDVFKRAFSPVEDARYTVEEAAIMIARIGRHGPWIDEERAKWLPKHHSSPEIKTYYHESPYADKILKEGFSMEIERRKDPGDFGWGVYLWPVPKYMPKGYTLEVDIDISGFAVINEPYEPLYERPQDTPEETLFRSLVWCRHAWREEEYGELMMGTIHGCPERGMSRVEVCKNVREEFLKRGVQGLITHHDHRAIEEIVLFDLSAIKDIRRHAD